LIVVNITLGTKWSISKNSLLGQSKEQGMKFRETTPKRQNITKEVSDYHEHKINLQKDFMVVD